VLLQAIVENGDRVAVSDTDDLAGDRSRVCYIENAEQEGCSERLEVAGIDAFMSIFSPSVARDLHIDLSSRVWLNQIRGDVA